MINNILMNECVKICELLNLFITYKSNNEITAAIELANNDFNFYFRICKFIKLNNKLKYIILFDVGADACYDSLNIFLSDLHKYVLSLSYKFDNDNKYYKFLKHFNSGMKILNLNNDFIQISKN